MDGLDDLLRFDRGCVKFGAERCQRIATALAIAAGGATAPPSPTPLTPSGLSGEGECWWIIRIAGHVAGGRQRVIHQRAGK